LVFQRNGCVHLHRRSEGGGGQFSRLLAVEVCGSAGKDCILFSKYVDHSLKMSLQGGKKRLKIVASVKWFIMCYKFMKTESEMDITNVCTKSIFDNFDDAVFEKNSS
jgi:hypothetical protein